MKGRRIPIPAATEQEFSARDDRSVTTLLEQPGDYLGPILGYAGDRPCVFLLKPNAHDPDAPRRARSWQYVAAPPHVFMEEPDGTLTITPSISDKTGQSESDGWHGYLTKGEWSKC
jgi:hypothetical protein